MTRPLCRICPTPAFFDFHEGMLLCADCAAEIFKLCEISDLAGSHQRAAPVVAATPSTVAAGASLEDGIPKFLLRAIS